MAVSALEGSADIVVQVPAAIGADGFERIVSETADIEHVGSYLLQPGYGDQLFVARSLDQDNGDPEVIYDARDIQVGAAELSWLKGHNVGRMVLGGAPDNELRELMPQADIGAIKEIKLGSVGIDGHQGAVYRQNVLSAVQSIVHASRDNPEGGHRRQRAFVANSIPTRHLASVLPHLVNRRINPVMHRLSLYLEDPASAGLLTPENMWVAPGCLELNRHYVVRLGAAASSAQIQDTVLAANEQLQLAS